MVLLRWCMRNIAEFKFKPPIEQIGGLFAGAFLREFTDGRPWAHLDIAGMAWADKPGATWGKGATGYGVRLLDRLIRDTAEG